MFTAFYSCQANFVVIWGKIRIKLTRPHQKYIESVPILASEYTSSILISKALLDIDNLHIVGHGPFLPCFIISPLLSEHSAILYQADTSLQLALVYFDNSSAIFAPYRLFPVNNHQREATYF